MYSSDSSRNDVLLDSDDYSHQSTHQSINQSLRSSCKLHRKKFLFIGVFLVLAFTVGIAIIVTRPDDVRVAPPVPPQPDCQCLNPGPPASSGRIVQLIDLFSNQLTISYSSISWSTADDSMIDRSKNGDIVAIDPSTNQPTVLVDGSIISQGINQPINKWTYSNDYRHWLFCTNYQPLYRHSGVGQYWLYSTNQSINQPKMFPDPATPMKLQYAALSPSINQPSIVYVYENDIYLYNLSSTLSIDQSTNQPTDQPIVRVTNDGSFNRLNGVLDWAYEEEVFSKTQSIWWNDQSTNFIYLSINQSMVPSMSFPIYDFPIDQSYQYKYPLVDQLVGYAQVGFYHVGDASGQLIDGLIELSVNQSTNQPINQQVYVIDVVWLTESSVAIKLMPRLQTTYQVYKVDLTTQSITRSTDQSLDQSIDQSTSQSITPVITKLHAASDPYYIDTHFFMRPIPSISQSINQPTNQLVDQSISQSLDQSINQYIDIGVINDRQHIALYHINGSVDRWLTSSPDWSVLNIHCIYQSTNQSTNQPINQSLFFTANFPTSIDRTLFSVNIQTGHISSVVDYNSQTNQPTSESTDQSINQSTNQPNVWQTASFSKSCKYFKLNEESRLLTVNLYSINHSTDQSINAEFVRTLKDNEKVKEIIDQSINQPSTGWALPFVVQSTLQSTVVKGESLNAHWIIPNTYKTPTDQLTNQSIDQPINQPINERDLFDTPNCSYKYPLLINPYGGPGSSQVSSRFKLGGNAGTSFHTYLASKFGIITLVVDPVGTGQKTESFQKNFTTLKLGLNEEVDFWGVIEQVRNLCFIDSERISFWGHSYGGYMATRMALSQYQPSDQSINGLSAQPFRLNIVIAGAPVTDWRLYDAIYTERYMRTSFDNLAGYQSTSTIFRQSTSPPTNPMAITARQFYLLHGTADDNVHYQNAALLAQNLTRQTSQFQQFSFINRNHGFNPFNGWGQAANQSYTAMHYYVLLTNIFKNMIVQPIMADGNVGIGLPIDQSINQPFGQSNLDVSAWSDDLDALDAMYRESNEEMIKERLGEMDRM